MSTLRLTLLSLVWLAAGCATSARVAEGVDAGQGEWGERFILDAAFFPVVWLQPDQDDPLTPNVKANDLAGPGAGLRAAIGNKDQSIGMLYMGSSPEDDAEQGADLNMLFFDFDVTMPIEGIPSLGLRAAAGVGAAWLEFDAVRFDDVTTGAANLRVDFEFRPSSTLGMLLGFGGFYLGYPGETEGYGTFVELGGRLTF